MDIRQYFLLATRSPLLLPKINHSKPKPHKQQYQKNKLQSQISSLANVYRLSSQIIRDQTREKQPKQTSTVNVIKRTMRTTTFIPSKKIQTDFDPKQIGSYLVGKAIGKGGFAKVFQCTDIEGNRYAIKQYDLRTGSECFKNESIVGKMFFPNNKLHSNENNNQTEKTGKENIIKFIDQIKIRNKAYIIQQLGGSNLSKMLSDIQGVFYNSERVYEVNFKPFYKRLALENTLKTILLQLCEAVQLLNNSGFIHCDLKSENVLISQNPTTQLPIAKLIDFGSTFQLCKGIPKITITPEYMPPELLNYLQTDYQIEARMDRIDIWSLGCILMEIVTGIPLWFKYRCKLTCKGRTTLQLGYFSLANRDYQKLIKKQKELSGSIQNIVFTFAEFEKFRPILKATLQFDPSKRISIDQLVSKVREID